MQDAGGGARVVPSLTLDCGSGKEGGSNGGGWRALTMMDAFQPPYQQDQKIFDKTLTNA